MVGIGGVAGLRSHFSSKDLFVMKEYGLDLSRILSLVTQTEESGGQVAKLTLATAQWIRLFKSDEDAQFLIEGCAYGFTWEADSPGEFYEIPNYVEKQHEQKVTTRVQRRKCRMDT
jgi:hypothetical protein